MLGPTIAGFLIEGGLSFPSAAVALSMGSLVAASALIFLKLGATEEPASTT